MAGPADASPTKERVTPTSEAELVDVVADALGRGRALEVTGGGTRRRYGRAVAADLEVSTAALTGVVDYVPEELVLTVRAGTRQAEVEALLAREGQRLAFAPPVYALGDAGDDSVDRAPTIGGVVGINAAGPARFRTGAARDYVLGVRGVSGRAEAFKAGGRVMKNVTGYDVAKLVTGAFGTLAVLTEVTFKVLPIPPAQLTAVVPVADTAPATAMMRAILATPAEVTGLSFLPGALASAWDGADDLGLATGGLVVRLEGPEAGFEHRLDLIARAVDGLAPTVVEHTALPAPTGALALSQALDTLAPLLSNGFDPARDALVRASVPPARAADVAAAFAPHPVFVDCAGHWLWAVVPGADAGTVLAAVRRTVADAGAVVARYLPPGIDPAVAPFSPQDPVTRRLHEGVKRGFDPERILNPGRMYEGL